MTHIIPVKLQSGGKTLWFDAHGISANLGDAVIVKTARGSEYGTVAKAPFDATQEQLSTLKSELKPVVRVANENDHERMLELQEKAQSMMPQYRAIVEEEGLCMRPISIEYLFDGEKAVFYFEAEERIDFRELVRKLAATFKVRVDMRQIGARDEASMVGGLSHCGQEFCCKRLGGEFGRVSIRMAKEQDLSLNPQKISGVCGRLMCCLRYEYEAYKDFKGRAPKLGAEIQTPDGQGKVMLLDVPREQITIQVEDDKKVVVPLEAFTKKSKDSARPDTIGQEAWQTAINKDETLFLSDSPLLTSQFTSESKLGEARAVHRETANKREKRERRGRQSAATNRTQDSNTRAGANGNGRGNGRGGKGSGRGSGKGREGDAAFAQTEATHRVRRRSTKLSTGQTSETSRVSQANQALRPGRRSSGLRQHTADTSGTTSHASAGHEVKHDSVRSTQRDAGHSTQRSTQRDAGCSTQRSTQHGVAQRSSQRDAAGRSDKRDAGHRRPRTRKKAANKNAESKNFESTNASLRNTSSQGVRAHTATHNEQGK